MPAPRPAGVGAPCRSIHVSHSEFGRSRFARTLWDACTGPPYSYRTAQRYKFNSLLSECLASPEIEPLSDFLYVILSLAIAPKFGRLLKNWTCAATMLVTHTRSYLELHSQARNDSGRPIN